MIGSTLITLGLLLLQETAEVGFDPLSMWKAMGWPARSVVVVLGIMSAWSIGVMIDRYIAFQGARKQSRVFSKIIPRFRACSIPACQATRNTSWRSAR